MGQVTAQPMTPVEVWPLLVIGSRSEQSSNGLNEAQYHRDQTDYRMGMPHSLLQLHPDEYVSGHRKRPGGDHEEAMPGEPLIRAAALAAHPRLLEVARKDDAQRGGSNPCGNHEGTVELDEQSARTTQVLHLRQIDRLRRGQASNVVVAHAVLLKAAAGCHQQMVLAIAKIKSASLHIGHCIPLHTAVDHSIHNGGVQQAGRVLVLERVVSIKR